MSQFKLNFRARLTLTLGALFLIMTFIASVILERVIEGNILRNNGQRLLNISYGVARVVASNLQEREREIKLLAKSAHLTNNSSDLREFSQQINAIQQSYPFYAWVGFANTQGVVESAASDLLVGKNVSSRPWFSGGKTGPFIGDLHDAVLLAKLLGAEDQSNPLRFIDFAAPVIDAKGELKGVVATHVHWNWMQNIVDGFLAKALKNDGVSVFVIDKSNKIISPLDAIGSVEPPNITKTTTPFQRAFWNDGVEYIYAFADIDSIAATNLNWRVVTRQPANFVGNAVRELTIVVIQVSAISLLVLFAISYWIARQISLPLEQLSHYADEVRTADEKVSWEVNSSVPELVVLSHSIQGMTERLFDVQDKLARTNIELEQTVEERTAELRAANKELELRANELNVLARIDQLTSIANRRAADEELTRLWNLFRRNFNVYSVILIDIDHFKRINDNYGHDVGDLTLQALAKILTSNSREVDTVARFGGEEFIVCLPDTDIIGAQHFAEKLCRSVAAQNFPEVGSVTISGGVASVLKQDANSLEIISRADVALYEAKNLGRNQIRIAKSAITDK